MLVWMMYMMGLLSGIAIGALGVMVRVYRTAERVKRAQADAEARQQSEWMSQQIRAHW